MLTPDRDEAQQLLEEELEDPQYQREFTGPLREAIDDLIRWLGENSMSLGAFDIPYGPLILTLVVVAVIVVIIVMVRPRLQAARRREPQLDTPVEVTAAELRSRAESHAAAGRWDDAAQDYFRAMVRGGEELGFLPPMTGRTATEAATELAEQLSRHSRRLFDAAALFNLSFYGGGRLGAEDAQLARELDRALLEQTHSGRRSQPDTLEAQQ